MALKFKTVVRRARFQGWGNFTPDRMLAIAEPVRTSVHDRILSGYDVQDALAPPLKSRVGNANRGTLIGIAGRAYSDRGYISRKQKLHPPAIRNWQFTGFTLRHLKVLTVGPGKAEIGFVEAVHPTGYKSGITVNQIVALNNRRWRQFGMSPHDKRVLAGAVLRSRAPRPISSVA